MTADRDATADAPIERRLAAAGLPPLPRLAWLEIDTDALAHNVGVVRRLVSAGVQIAAVVKSDGYGHGIQAAARAFLAGGADALCVATVDEAQLLRSVGVDARLLVLFAVPAAALDVAVDLRLEVVAATGDVDPLIRAGRRAAAAGSALAVHLEVETGLGRAGQPPAEIAGVAHRLTQTPGLRIAGIFSHLASSHDAAASAEQVARFRAAARSLAAAGLPDVPRHIGATGALLGSTAPAFELVRPGLMLYGEQPAAFPVAPAAMEAIRSLRPAMTLKARPLRVETIEAGEGIGYGSLWRADRRATVATLPAGYGDGWSRAYSPGAQALVRGRRVPLVGSVAMDAIAVDVTSIGGVTPDDEFVLLGAQGDHRITAAELARLRNTISWEVLSSMAWRVPRVYHPPAGPSGVRTLTGESLAAPLHRSHEDTA